MTARLGWLLPLVRAFRGLLDRMAARPGIGARLDLVYRVPILRTCGLLLVCRVRVILALKVFLPGAFGHQLPPCQIRCGQAEARRPAA